MKHNSTQITEARIAVALYLKQQIDQVERDAPGQGTAPALRAIAQALQAGAFDHAIEPAEIVIEHKPETTTEKHEAVSEKQQPTDNKEPAIDMNKMADQVFETA